ncbi:hypothetical protein B0F90DRAFT_800153 [Multifurca ochricompacta]|uniref:Uncharacterized protein n=1 Tax=Multifurca ochricompacta TaxID=376703 RepID=A0AAD4QS00_9AGAM|nr:hypothetical protein B0F90DRAFT_800153 [Multifurca ochricompacta]
MDETKLFIKVHQGNVPSAARDGKQHLAVWAAGYNHDIAFRAIADGGNAGGTRWTGNVIYHQIMGYPQEQAHARVYMESAYGNAPGKPAQHDLRTECEVVHDDGTGRGYWCVGKVCTILVDEDTDDECSTMCTALPMDRIRVPLSLIARLLISSTGS